YLKVPSRGGLTGKEVAERILMNNQITDVTIEAVEGGLTDHYDPRKKVLRLSKENYYGKSLAAAGVSAHEVGHAIQHNVAYGPLKLRSAAVPVSQFGSYLSFPLIFAGFIFQNPSFLDIGIIAYTAVVAFTVVTLPVEFNASSRAITEIQNSGALDPQEIGGAKKVLNAAALTYVAAASVAVIQLLRLLLLRQAMDD
ncbi:MAG: zinc metallopeptidase, partial [bacterium]|nr:zinc metallopeptidase [bacterium]